MKTTYNTQKDISRELKRLRLQRDISIEELKLVKQQFKDDLSANKWFKSVLASAGKFGLYKLLQKVTK